jgi:hypothetical protein
MKKCKFCDKDIPNRNIFCDNKCQSEFQNSIRIKEWINGKNFLRSDGLLVPSWIRKFLLKESNYSCSECGWNQINEFTNQSPLEIDHIDGDSKNNLKDNLRVLCPNCHSLKCTFKNTGSRKSSRNRKNNLTT